MRATIPCLHNVCEGLSEAFGIQIPGNSHMLTYGSCRAPVQERGSSLSSLRNAGLDMTLEGLEPRTQLGNRRLTGTIQQKQYPGASCPAVYASQDYQRANLDHS